MSEQYEKCIILNEKWKEDLQKQSPQVRDDVLRIISINIADTLRKIMIDNEKKNE